MHWKNAGVAAACLALLAVAGCSKKSKDHPAPTASLTAAAADVKSGDAVNLTWSSTDAKSCSAAGGGWSGSLGTSGSTSRPVTSTTTFTITCSSKGGSASSSATVTAWNAPAPTISADLTSILASNTVAVTWSSQNATTCTGADGLSGALATSGSQTSPTLTTTTVLSVSCSNPAFAAVKASVTIDVSTTLTATVTVQYQAPGVPVIDPAIPAYVPDWANPVTKPIPLVWVELQNPAGQVVQQVYADASGVATFTGLNPAVAYTPVVRSKINPASGFDFVVLNNTAPLDTSKTSYRTRYSPYANPGAPYTPNTRAAAQSMGTLTAGMGWDANQRLLVDANRAAAPYALLANAVFEAQIVSAAIGGATTWRPLSILWSATNKGGLSTPPNNLDQGFVTGSGGFYNGGGHLGVDGTGKETLASVAEDAVFIAGDQSSEIMDLYPFVLTHEMGHFTQSLFSSPRQTPGGSHTATDYQDPTLSWAEGSASGIAALVLQTSKQNRVLKVGGQVLVVVVDVGAYTVNGNAQTTWPLGWYQENTVTRLMWQLYDPAGALRLPAATVLAPMFSAAWKAGPWFATPWAFTAQLAKLNPANAAAISTLADSFNIRSTGNDEWGSTETSAGSRSAQVALPPYTTVNIGAAPVTICSAGAANEYNKQSNVRYIRIPGDGAVHSLTVQGASGTVPLIDRNFAVPGSSTFTASATMTSPYRVLSLGACSVALSPNAASTAACNEPTPPPAQQCWQVSVQ